MAGVNYQGEDVIITFEKEGADTVKNIEARVTNININTASADVETTRTFGGNSIQTNKPVGDYEVSFDYVTRDTMFNEIAFDNGATQGPTSGTEYRSGNESSKKRWRVVIWFLGEGAGTAKSGSVVVPLKVGEIQRYIFKDCYSVSNNETFASDDMAKGTINLKTSPTDEDGYANVFISHTNAYATTALTTLNATAHKGALTWNTTSPAWTGSYRT